LRRSTGGSTNRSWPWLAPPSATPPPPRTWHRSLGIYTEGELDEIAKFGSYAGWRIGIDENGEWLFFIAGD